ncbi:hypothetical protein PV755_45450 [Streptomyces caniscabiei]|uniref:Uncharacterized protein n=1 Tax=Streptomyces caniscabiei TaxID=2746961 RepID=A0A927L156_9ACTN|nr:hypothetical protein [Streptomyces caniscabiei]MBD9723439.1 hypothetical protein [Streptomyces caniscabiei]MDX3516063.1 hypothetical protein [Streptomyces caniscabiei]MDX3725131.1 hypothetical protein [Streptomyces caniscabiei]WEO27009.1 hypothetical protein IHE65_29780 [Streptomyces caniscabiei]
MPTVAPLVAAFKRRLVNLPGPVRASGEASNGEPVQVEMRVAGQAVDITSFTMVRDDSGQISLTRGMRAEASQTEAAESRDFQLRNTDGRFNPNVPTGEYFGEIGRNTEVWWSVPDGLGGKSYRLRGEVSDWSQGWEKSGNDVWTDVKVSGILQRLAQGPAADHSVIYQAITDPVAPSVVAYWPCEDPTGSTSLASALASGSRMTWTGTLNLAAYDGFKSSDPLPDLTTATLTGGIARYSDPTAHQIRFLAHIPLEGLSDGKVLCAIDQEQYGGATFWELYYTTTGNTLILRQHDSDGALLGIELTHTVDVRGRHMYISVELVESSTSVTRAIRVTDITSGTVYSATDTAASTQLTRLTRLQFGPASRSAVGPVGTQYLPGVSIGHVTAENAVSATTALGVRLNPIGETAGRRIQRLCAEEGIPFQWIGDLDDTVEMGAQDRQNPLSLMQECVKADGGMLYETLDVLGLGYRTRDSLERQDPALVLSYSGHHLFEVPVPVGDDRYLANKVTVTANGVSATYEETEGRLSTAYPPAGVGPYGPNSDGAGLSLNLAATDVQTLRDHAAWRVRFGTVDEDRFPRISVNLAHPSFVNDPALKQAVLALRQGDRVQIENPPAWLPPDTIDQIILGFEESITHFQHEITLVCAPAAPYNSTGLLDNEDARIDTDGSELVAAVTDSATTVYVAPSAGESCLWTTDTTDMPFDVRAGGEVMSVTACTGVLEDAFSRTSSNSWGSADTGQAWTAAGGVAADYSVGSGYGVHVLSTVDATRRTSIAAVHPDCDFYGSITTSALATGNSLFGAITARMLDSENMYMARLEFTTSNTIVLMLRKLVANVGTDLGSVTVPATHVAGTFIRVRLQCQGTAIKTKAWVAGTVEPPWWDVEATDSSIVAANSLGTRSITVTGNTNGAAVQIRYDDFDVVNPQTFTVTRSVNGCVKAHSAGTDVRLAYPTYLAL